MFYKRHHKGSPQQRKCEGSIPHFQEFWEDQHVFCDMHISLLPFPLFFFLFIADQLESKREKESLTSKFK